MSRIYKHGDTLPVDPVRVVRELPVNVMVVMQYNISHAAMTVGASATVEDYVIERTLLVPEGWSEREQQMVLELCVRLLHDDIAERYNI